MTTPTQNINAVRLPYRTNPSTKIYFYYNTVAYPKQREIENSIVYSANSKAVTV